MFNRIVVPVDSSALSRRALAQAFELAQYTGAKLTVLCVKQIILLYYGALGPESQYISLEKLDGEEILNTMLSDMDISPDSIRKRSATTGNPALLIVAVAAEEGADLIVMGSRGFSLFTGFILGSISRSVIKHAPCPVLIVK